MFKNYFKIALRTLAKAKVYSIINVSGLAVGMACAIFIGIYVRYELGFDNFHEKRDRIYQVNLSSARNGGTFYTASTMSPLAPVLVNEMPGIVSAARYKTGGRTLVRYGEKRFYEDGFSWADADFLEIFSFPLRAGEAGAALREPYSIVISKTMADKYFAGADPVGKILRIDNARDFTVTGVFEKLPPNSSLSFDFLASFQTLEAASTWRDKWGDVHLNTFVLLQENVSAADIDAGFAGVLDKHYSFRRPRTALFLQPLAELHLYDRDRSPRGLTVLYFLSAVGVIILLIAAINYMNLATARSMHRSKEVGLRKVIGASRRQLAGQFLGESIILSLLALPLALLLVELVLPTFNRFFSTIMPWNFAPDITAEPVFLFGLLALALLIGLIGGSYPALALSRFKPAAVLSDAGGKSVKGARFRRNLVVLQFIFSIFFMIATAIIADQLSYLQSKDWGYEKEQIISLRLNDELSVQRAELFKNRLLQHHNIRNASLCDTSPARLFGRTSGVYPEGVPKDENRSMHIFSIDRDYIETFGLELMQGRNFSREMATDFGEAYILNETAVRNLGWDAPIGKQITISGRETPGTVIGVVKDFHFQRMTSAIQPALLQLEPQDFRTLALKINQQDVAQTLAFVETQWNAFAPDFPFEVTFFDAEAERLFLAHRLMFAFSRGFTIFAVFIACLGLLGLAAFTAERRTREIGVRKVLGASVPNVVALLSKDFLKLIVIAFLIATPLAWLLMSALLQNFAYRTAIDAAPFLLVGIMAFGIALLTVSTQAIRAALANPVDSLRYE